MVHHEIELAFAGGAVATQNLHFLLAKDAVVAVNMSTFCKFAVFSLGIFLSLYIKRASKQTKKKLRNRIYFFLETRLSIAN